MKKLIVSIAVMLITLCSSAWASDTYIADTIWLAKTDQIDGYYMVKFSDNDSIIVANGYYRDLFFETATGKEIKRIEGNCEVFFINNDSNFIRLNPDRKNYEIYDTQTWKVIDTLANDSTSLTYGAATASKDENYFVSVFQLSATQYGIRVWNIKTRKILQTKILQIDTKLNSLKLFRIRYINNNTKIIIGFDEDWYDDSYPNNLHNNIYYPIFDANTLDSIDVFALPSDKYYTDYVISKTDKYIVFMVADKDYGVHLYDLNTEQLLNKFYVNGYSLTAMEFSADDSVLLTNSNDFVFWNLKNYQKLYDYGGGTGYSNAISHNNKYLLVPSGNYIGLLKTKFYLLDDVIDYDINKLITITPNPTSDILKIIFNYDVNRITTISLMDTIGNQIKTLFNGYIIKNNEYDFDISDINNGAYIINIKNTNANYNYKIIISK